MFSLTCSSGKPANVPKPISVGITSSLWVERQAGNRKYIKNQTEALHAPSAANVGLFYDGKLDLVALYG
jgi:hypothetical protein